MCANVSARSRRCCNTLTDSKKSVREASHGAGGTCHAICARALVCASLSLSRLRAPIFPRPCAHADAEKGPEALKKLEEKAAAQGKSVDEMLSEPFVKWEGKEEQMLHVFSQPFTQKMVFGKEAPKSEL